MDVSCIFVRPLLIYDDKCSSCTKFAKAANILSGGWIRTAGHYYSQEAIEAKKLVFPPGFDATKMFWLINGNGAYGARYGLIQVVKEIIIGLYKRKREKNNGNHTAACEYKDQTMSCGSTKDTLKRILNMMRNSDRFAFPS
jgi:hypothetical protein